MFHKFDYIRYEIRQSKAKTDEQPNAVHESKSDVYYLLKTNKELKGKWQQKILSSYLKKTPKQYKEIYYRIFNKIFISALLGEIF